MRCTLEIESSLSFAMPRELQWVASFGRLSKVFTMVASMRASSIVLGGSRPWLVAQAIQAVLYKAPTPLADRHLDHTELRRHLLVLATGPRRPKRSGSSTPGLGPSCGGLPTPSV
jgi:hypothetical protein